MAETEKVQVSKALRALVDALKSVYDEAPPPVRRWVEEQLFTHDFASQLEAYRSIGFDAGRAEGLQVGKKIGHDLGVHEGRKIGLAHLHALEGESRAFDRGFGRGFKAAKFVDDPHFFRRGRHEGEPAMPPVADA